MNTKDQKMRGSCDDHRVVGKEGLVSLLVFLLTLIFQVPHGVGHVDEEPQDYLSFNGAFIFSCPGYVTFSLSSILLIHFKSFFYK